MDMQRPLTSFAFGIPLIPVALLACAPAILEDNRPCPCEVGWSCCANTCLPEGATCRTGDAGPAVGPESDGGGAFEASFSFDSGGDSASLACVGNWSLTPAGEPAADLAFNVAIGDLNGDHKPDLVVGGVTGATVFLGRGDGTFTPKAQPNPPMGTAQAIALGDLNGDGHPDLVMVLDAVTVFLGNGDGTFQNGVPYELVGGSAVAIADLNGDGKLDLAVNTVPNGANSDAGTTSPGGIAILLGHGDGTFAPPSTTYPAGPGSFSVAIADLNGDGRLDLAVADQDLNGPAGSVSVLLGPGNGTFPTAVAYPTSMETNAVAAADLNGDGTIDLAVTNSGSNAVGVLLGRGDGTFLPQVTYPTDGDPTAIAIRDLNADGAPDLVVANESSSDVSVFLGRGDGSFGTEVPFTTGQYPSSVAIGDLNGDELPDVAVATQGSSGVSILLGTCSH
jgi:FG-GAP-like repeat